MLFEKIRPFTEYETTQLLLLSCQRILHKEEVDLDDDSGYALQKRLSLEPNVQKLDNNPTNIINLGRLLRKHEFKDVEVKKLKADPKKHQPDHHLAKPHSDIAKISLVRHPTASHEDVESKLLD
jgi:hypothetical protein